MYMTVPTAFTSTAAGVLRQAQVAITELLFGVGFENARPTDIGRELGLDKTLAWKVSRFISDTDPLRAARHMPGPSGIKILLQAAEALGAPQDRIDAVSNADAEFRRFVEERAGDLRTFEAMLTGSGNDAKAELEQRRKFFQAGAAVWGVRASAQFLMLALCPAEQEEGMLDVVQTSGFVCLERLKPGTPWIVRRLTTTDDGGRRLSYARVPLDQGGVTGPGALPLLREFCSDPPPQIRQFEGRDGVMYDEIEPGQLGPVGAVTVVTGELYRAAVSSVRSDDNHTGRYKLSIRTPVQRVLFDVLLHKSLTHFSPMSMSFEPMLEGRPRESDRQADDAKSVDALPAKHLGTPPVLKTSRLTMYESIARRALALGGYTLDDFRGYRADMQYPAAPSEVILSCDIS